MSLSASTAAVAFLVGAGLGSYCTAWVLIVGSMLVGLAGLGVCAAMPTYVAMHTDLFTAAAKAAMVAEAGFLAAAATRVYVFSCARA